MRIDFAFECHEQWDDMSGETGQRHCARCNEHVTDLSAMTAAQAKRFLERTGGEACVSYLVDADGEAVFRPALPAVGVRGTVKAAMLTLPLLLAACESGEPTAAPVATPVQTEDPAVSTAEVGAIAKNTDPKQVEEADPSCDDAAEHDPAENGAKNEPPRHRLGGKPKPLPRYDDLDVPKEGGATVELLDD